MILISQYIIELQDAHVRFEAYGAVYEFHSKPPIYEGRDGKTGCKKAIFQVSTLRNPDMKQILPTMDEIMNGTWIHRELEVYEESIDGPILLRLEGAQSIYKMIEYRDRHSSVVFENNLGHRIKIG
jgi:hypothetical protein